MHWLVVFIFINGSWQPGASLTGTGWAPRAYETRTICQTRLKFARSYMKKTSRKPTKWFCTTDRDAILQTLEAATR